ncbi:SanA/YdcF family protein [Halomonas dongshanensis]|nr:ElyC/SanA/YdcF family protein [Halomonas dongshanensis]
MVIKWIKRTLIALGAALLLALLLLLAGNAWVLAQTRTYIEQPLSQCRASRVGVVFGTSNWTRSGVRNPHFHARMHSAAELVATGRVEHLLLSGDNRTQAYNEPRAMWRDLHRRGVPAEKMTMDFAGFSTYDTLARAHEVFQLDEAVLVTQYWHLPRAIYIARAMGMEVTGCLAEAPAPIVGEWRLRIREWLARVATLGDLYLWGRAPYFLGPAEPIVIPAEPAPVAPVALPETPGTR